MNVRDEVVQNAFLQAATKAWDALLVQATEDGADVPDCNLATVRVTIQLQVGDLDVGACQTQVALKVDGSGVVQSSWQRLLSNE